MSTFRIGPSDTSLNSFITTNVRTAVIPACKGDANKNAFYIDHLLSK